MLFDEKEMLDICKKYGIDVVEKKGYPLCNGQEMDESFSVRDIMNDTYHASINKKTIYSEIMEVRISIDFEKKDYTNFSLNSMDNPYFMKINKGEYDKSVKPLILDNNNISIAA